MADKPKKDALATSEAYPLAVMDPENRLDLAAIAEEVGASPQELMRLLFTRVKFPSGGGSAFEIENADDPNDPFVEKTIEGVIVTHHPVNVFWKEGFEETGGGTPPDCVSADGELGYGDRKPDDEPGAHVCATCPLNEFGSDPSGGKACQNRHHLYIMRGDDLIPTLVVLPPTSLRPWRAYATKSILTRGRKTYGVVTRIGLEKQKSGDNIEYSRATFALISTLPADQTTFLGKYGADLKSVVAENVPAIITATATSTGDAGEGEPF